MTMSKKTKDIAIASDRSRTAAGFVARLYSGDMSSVEAEQIEDWLADDDANRREFDRVVQTWDELEALSDQPEILAIADRNDTWVSRRRRLNRASLAATGSAIVALVAVLFAATVLIDRFGSASEYVYATQVGERRTVSLSDGSQVTLNTNSKIRVVYGPDARNITLEYGEAFFDIRRDPTRPFQLVAGNSLVTVLGTKFNVRWSGLDVTVAVVEGLVAVRPVPFLAGQSAGNVAAIESDHPATEEVLLETGSFAVFSETLSSTDKNYAAHMDDLQGWRFGFVRFDSDPLYEVIGELNRYSTTTISIADKDIMELPISGIFSIDDIDKILTGLEAVFPIDVIRRFDGYSIVSADSEERD